MTNTVYWDTVHQSSCSIVKFLFVSIFFQYHCFYVTVVNIQACILYIQYVLSSACACYITQRVLKSKIISNIIIGYIVIVVRFCGLKNALKYIVQKIYCVLDLMLLRIGRNMLVIIFRVCWSYPFSYSKTTIIIFVHNKYCINHTVRIWP